MLSGGHVFFAGGNVVSKKQVLKNIIELVLNVICLNVNIVTIADDSS